MKNQCLLSTCGLITALLFAIPAKGSEAGKALYAPCVTCHGANGEGNLALNAPALAGQDAAYLQRQLRHFKSGVRGADPKDALGAQMRGMAATLVDDQAIKNVAEYVSGLAPKPATDRAKGNLRNGSNQYQASCGACHGGTAEGNPLLHAPRLNTLGAAYMKRQYRHFQRGIRGGHADDRYGKQMAMMADSLPGDKDLDDVIAFIHAQFKSN